ncbi:monovalent cation/H+ antiporter subunit D family protein [Magnetospirillum sp. SS-4]|uniref:monovalent cation/H+ antiporter subunit D family protein n=1 Tax=Magnetospirillum sp. SS-4 TaxID=2681465 RepID=UPI001380E5A2|nr:monovalent cation/H+ antiporter subunit D family protein [Magnetospirillum sp. SS-4]CAA7620725.1 NADH-quinone oxidoreductase subunit N [Magnetospirillum sp. SS-4]
MTISEHLPALVVVLPLMAAPACVMLRHPFAAWLVASGTSWLCLLMSALLLRQVADHGAFSYQLGNWAAPWGIEYRIDMASAFILVIVSAIAAVVSLYARASVAHEIEQSRQYLFHALFVVCLSGLLGIAITGDAFNLFVFLEISSLSTYAMVALGRDRRALTAAMRYLVLGTVGATFYVIGVGLAYMMTGTLNMADLAARLPAVIHTSTAQAGLAFLVIGIGLKMAAFPLHFWLPDAYAHAPSAASAFLAGTATKVAVYAFLRMVVGVFGATGILAVAAMADMLMVVAVLGMVVGSAVAIWQTDIRRALAYSSVAQIGYVLLGISLLTEAGLAAGIVHLFNHAVMKSALFLALGSVFLRLGSVRIADLAGIGRRMPLSMAAFLVAGLSMIGVPLTVGFVSKWYLVEAILHKGLWPVAVLVLLSSLLAVVYVWRVVEVMWFAKPSALALTAVEAPLSMLVPTWMLAGAAVWFGVDATGTMAVARAAAAVLMTGVGQ